MILLFRLHPHYFVQHHQLSNFTHLFSQQQVVYQPCMHTMNYVAGSVSVAQSTQYCVYYTFQIVVHVIRYTWPNALQTQPACWYPHANSMGSNFRTSCSLVFVHFPPPVATASGWENFHLFFKNICLCFSLINLIWRGYVFIFSLMNTILQDYTDDYYHFLSPNVMQT